MPVPTYALCNQEVVGFLFSWLSALTLVPGELRMVKGFVLSRTETKMLRRMKADSQMSWLDQRER